MNICICVIGKTNLNLNLDVPIFKYPSDTPHFIAVNNAIEEGFTSAMILDNAIFDNRKVFMMPTILKEIQEDRNNQCIFLGGEHFGILIGSSNTINPLFSIKNCTLTNGSHAYILRYSGMRNIVNRSIIKPNMLTWKQMRTAAIIPSIAFASECPTWVTKLPHIPAILPKFTEHKKLLEFLEHTWQSLMKAIVAYILFWVTAEKIKDTIRNNCT